MKFMIDAEEVIERNVRANGTGAHIYVPKKWEGRNVKVCLIPTEDYRNFKLISKLNNREFYGELKITINKDFEVFYYRKDGLRVKTLEETITDDITIKDKKLIENIYNDYDDNLLLFIQDEIDKEFDNYKLEIIR